MQHGVCLEGVNYYGNRLIGRLQVAWSVIRILYTLGPHANVKSVTNIKLKRRPGQCSFTAPKYKPVC